MSSKSLRSIRHVRPFRLDQTGADGQSPAEPVYGVHDRPRDAFIPDIVTEPGADILEVGVEALRRLIG